MNAAVDAPSSPSTSGGGAVEDAIDQMPDREVLGVSIEILEVGVRCRKPCRRGSARSTAGHVVLQVAGRPVHRPSARPVATPSRTAPVVAAVPITPSVVDEAPTSTMSTSTSRRACVRRDRGRCETGHEQQQRDRVGHLTAGLTTCCAGPGTSPGPGPRARRPAGRIGGRGRYSRPAGVANVLSTEFDRARGRRRHRLAGRPGVRRMRIRVADVETPAERRAVSTSSNPSSVRSPSASRPGRRRQPRAPAERARNACRAASRSRPRRRPASSTGARSGRRAPEPVGGPAGPFELRVGDGYDRWPARRRRGSAGGHVWPTSRHRRPRPGPSPRGTPAARCQRAPGRARRRTLVHRLARPPEVRLGQVRPCGAAAP